MKFPAMIIKLFKRIKKNPRFLILCCIAISLALFLYISSLPTTIIFTEQGFFPQELQVKKNTTVRFVNNSKHTFWPASNLHPTHDIYKEFDAGKGVAPGKYWTFTFTQSGVWVYHDHLTPTFTGTIRVVDKGDMSLNLKIQEEDDCNNQSEFSQKQCFDDVLRKIIRVQGLEKGFDFFVRMYTEKPVFASNCHTYTHVLGQEAYTLFLKKKNIPPHQAMTYCGYGFYHGFIETLLTRSNDYQLARSFCDLKVSDVALSTTRTLDCYHGIGHGFLDPQDKRIITDTQKIIDESLKKCHDLTQNREYLSRCANGVYNGVAVSFAEPRNVSAPLDNDPLILCKKQPNQFKIECFSAMSFLIMEIVDNDFEKAIDLIAHVPEVEYRVVLMPALAGYNAYSTIDSRNYTATALACMNASAGLTSLCITGTVEGLVDFGTPGKEHEEGLTFCTTGGFSESLRNTCLSHLITYVGRYLGESRQQQLCKQIKKTYEITCN